MNNFHAQKTVLRKVISYLIKEGYSISLYPEYDVNDEDAMVSHSSKIVEIMNYVAACDVVTMIAEKSNMPSSHYWLVWNDGEPHPINDYSLNNPIGDLINREILNPAEALLD